MGAPPIKESMQSAFNNSSFKYYSYILPGSININSIETQKLWIVGTSGTLTISPTSNVVGG